MAKAKAKKQPKDEPKPLLMDPEAIHRLLGMMGPYKPYEPPEPPIPTKGYATFWDCGMSINTLAKKNPELFRIP